MIPVCRVGNLRGASPWIENSLVASAAHAFEDRRPPKRGHPNEQWLDRILRSILVRSIGRCAREAVISISFLFCVFGLAGIPLAHASEPSWAGMWDTQWRGGGARITLQERDGKVTGEYAAYGGKIEGEVHDRELTGHWIEGPRSGGIDFVLASDGRSFMGRFDNGEWWTGRRIVVSSRGFVDQSGVREALRTFVVAGDAARRGSFDELAEAAAVLDFGEAGGGMVPGQKLAAAGELFDLVNLTTIHLWTIPGKRAPGDHFDLILAQAGSGAVLPLSLVKKDAGWFIVYPSADALTNARKALLARSNGRLPPPGDYKRRTSARDAVRSFLDAFNDWGGAGHDQALDALDLSDFSEAVRVYEGELAAQYLKEVIDRIGDVVPQEIPDDPTSFEPYTLFSHPTGSIVVAATGGDKPSWKFDSNSVRTARDLFVAVEDMPALASAGSSAPKSGYFRLRRWIRDFSPTLLRPVGSLEAWQAAGWVLVLAVSLGLAFALSAVLLAILRRASRAFGGEHSSTEPDLRWPLRLSLTFSIYKQLIPIIGLPDLAKRFSVGATGVVLAIALMWVGWRLIDFVGEIYSSRAKSARVRTDHVVMSLTFGALKLALIAAGCSFIAVELSLPYEGVLASLSIGGLAVAFASRETLSNVFGAGILAVDRPFKSGDRIIAGEIQGRVERVGIRSTRIRTDDDSLVIVPNGKLSDSVVNNLGARRSHMIRAKLPLSYATTVDQIVKFQEGVMELIANTPHAVSESSRIMVSALGQERIDVELTLCLDGQTGTAHELEIINQFTIEVLRFAESIGVKFGARYGQLSDFFLATRPSRFEADRPAKVR